MESNVFVKGMLGVFAVGVLAGCGTEQPEDELQYVNLSQAACTFLGSGSEPLVIEIEASHAWKAEAGATWVKAEPGEDGNTLLVAVDDNDTDAERSTEIVVTAAMASQKITVYQLADEPSFNRFRKDRMFINGAVVSPGGRYIGGFENEALQNDAWNYYPVVIDTETGERVKLGPFPSSLFFCSQPFAITDYGRLFISDHRNGGTVVFDLDGDYMLSDTPEGCAGPGNINGVSGDGSVWVGYSTRKIEGQSGVQYCPVIWENGVARILPLPEKNFKGQPFSTGGAMARGCSADGSVIYGTTWENSDGAMIYWKDGRVGYVGEDVHEIKSVVIPYPEGDEEFFYANGMVSQAEIYKISPSGNWIAGAYQKVTVSTDDYSAVAVECPAFYNTETEKTVVLEEYSGAKGVHVTDDGLGFIHVPLDGGRVYDLNAGVAVGTVAEWVQSEYGIVIPSDIFIKSVSPDGKVVLGTGTEQPSGVKGRIYPWYIIPPVQR